MSGNEEGLETKGGLRSRGCYPLADSGSPPQTHLPGFVEQADALKAKGIQVVACLTVNAVFVTEEWARAHKAEGKVSCGSCRGSGAKVEIFL